MRRHGRRCAAHLHACGDSGQGGPGACETSIPEKTKRPQLLRPFASSVALSPEFPLATDQHLSRMLHARSLPFLDSFVHFILLLRVAASTRKTRRVPLRKLLSLRTPPTRHLLPSPMSQPRCQPRGVITPASHAQSHRTNEPRPVPSRSRPPRNMDQPPGGSPSAPPRTHRSPDQPHKCRANKKSDHSRDRPFRSVALSPLFPLATEDHVVSARGSSFSARFCPRAPDSTPAMD